MKNMELPFRIINKRKKAPSFYALIAVFIVYLINNPPLNAQQLPEPMIFDDFNYSSSKFPIDTNEYGSVFGWNPWLTTNGYKNLKAWVRWNIGNPPFGKHCFVEPSKEGVSIYMMPGNIKNEFQPCFHSTFVRRHGTYASRVKFPVLPDYQRFDIAYWLFSSVGITFKGIKGLQYWDEMDFEWNDCFIEGETNQAIGLNNRVGKMPFQKMARCVFEHNKKRIPCRCDSKFNGVPLVADQWGVGVFVVDTEKKQVSIYMRIDNWNGTDDKVWLGFSEDEDMWGKPYVIKNYEPYWDMVAFYSFASGFDDIKQKINFDIDWFLYLPRTDLSYEDLESIVTSLKANNLPRVNTVNARFWDKDYTPDIKGEVYLDGPKQIQALKESGWLIKFHYNRWSGYEVDFRYRYHKKDGTWDEWIPIYDIYPKLTPMSIDDTLEFSMFIKDFWYDYRDTLNMKIPITAADESDLRKEEKFKAVVFPNPAWDYIGVNIEILEPANLEVAIYDSRGNILADLFKGEKPAGVHKFVFTTGGMTQEIYYVKVICNGDWHLYPVIKI